MAVGANIPDLAALYEQLKTSMQDADTMVNQLDSRLTQANEEWKSKGAHEFNDAWHNGFKPSLTKLCQALATAGRSSWRASCCTSGWKTCRAKAMFVIRLA